MCNFETLSVGNPAHSDRVVKNWKLTRWNNKMMSCVWVRFRWKSGEKQKNVLITTGEKQLSHLPPGHKSLLHCLCQLVCHLVAMDCCSHTEEGFNGTFSCYFACLTFCQLVIIFVGSIKHCRLQCSSLKLFLIIVYESRIFIWTSGVLPHYVYDQVLNQFMNGKMKFSFRSFFCSC